LTSSLRRCRRRRLLGISKDVVIAPIAELADRTNRKIGVAKIFLKYVKGFSVVWQFLPASVTE
jgi:hypothetical protein